MGNMRVDIVMVSYIMKYMLKLKDIVIILQEYIVEYIFR